LKYEIAHRPAYCTLDLVLDAGEAIVAQPGSMITMDTGFDLTTATGGAVSRSGPRAILGSLAVGESFVRSRYESKRDGQRLSLAPNQPGDIFALDTTEEEGFLLSRGSWLANTEGVSIDVVFGGVKGWMTQTGIFLMSAKGAGQVFCTAHGAAVRLELAPGERVLVDNRNIVAFSAGMTYQAVTVTKQLRTAALSGEGLVNRYEGPGVVLYQTRPNNRSTGMLSALFQAFF
jgi:uncharacterized protein (TIGR00266 family)